MRRRDFIAMLCSAAALPLAAHAQQIAKLPRVGWLSPGSRTSDENFLAFFHDGLRELGWVVGQNIAIESRWAEGRFERLPDLAAELVRLKVDVIVTEVTQASLAAKRATRTIPIVSVATHGLVEARAVASLGRPGGNVTGIEPYVGGLPAKQMDLAREIVPGATKIGLLTNNLDPKGTPQVLELKAAGQALDLKIMSTNADRPEEIEAALQALATEKSM